MKALPIKQADELIAMGLDYKTADAYYDGTVLLDNDEQKDVLFNLIPSLSGNTDLKYIQENNLHLTWTLEALLKVLPKTYTECSTVYRMRLTYNNDTPCIVYSHTNDMILCEFTAESFLDAVYECVKWFLVQGIL